MFYPTLFHVPASLPGPIQDCAPLRSLRNFSTGSGKDSRRTLSNTTCLPIRAPRRHLVRPDSPNRFFFSCRSSQSISPRIINELVPGPGELHRAEARISQRTRIRVRFEAGQWLSKVPRGHRLSAEPWLGGDNRLGRLNVGRGSLAFGLRCNPGTPSY